ncbi:HNH endonuclease [Allomuricauda sp. CP2A]|jgi:hypothetical protein|uniref:HNH endonuclease n=1 Tax=Allomuricauda sp. CP2A TaxID=1848189 RepID=UPI000835CBED|nr:HNH endonuclease [Muricauda sp. CP2A]
MRCIFCKKSSGRSSSIQHIIPESLGNKELILRPGVVCDECNQYFAVKIEKPLLEMKYFQNVRFRNNIKSIKERNIPYKTLFPHKDGGWFDMYMDGDSLGFRGDDTKVINLIRNKKVNKLMFEVVDMPENKNYQMSRFLAKTALELFALKAGHNQSNLNEVIDMSELDPLREYARFGKGEQWIYSQRRIYSEEARFVDPIFNPKPYEVLHELDFLIIEPGIYYFVLVIMGVEYVINCGASELNLFNDWLERNENQSPIRRFTERMVKE